jgi:hypothetical protein
MQLKNGTSSIVFIIIISPPQSTGHTPLQLLASLEDLPIIAMLGKRVGDRRA